MKIKVRTIIGILLLLVVAAVLAYVLPNHLREIEDMRIAAQTLGMMYCLPQWVGGRAETIYICAAWQA